MRPLRASSMISAPPSAPEAGAGRPATKARSGGGSIVDWSIGDGCSGADGEGCIAAIVVVVALGAALGIAWVFVELAMPLAFFLLYAVLMRAIRRAASDRRGCAGDLAKSLGWGALWATIYVLPIAALTWVVHAVHR